MKKISFAALVFAALMFSSCMGSFATFNKLTKWEANATESKFLNECIFFVLMPVNAVAGVLDLFVVNSIEFWSGENPLLAKVGKTYNVKGDDGVTYAVTILRNGYDVKTPAGEHVKFIHDDSTDAWSVTADGKTTELIRFNENGIVAANIAGTTINITNDEAGFQQLRNTVNGNCWAMR